MCPGEDDQKSSNPSRGHGHGHGLSVLSDIIVIISSAIEDTFLFSNGSIVYALYCIGFKCLNTTLCLKVI